ncbi:hypothetical protein N8I77_001104 [Diaporthe amygdali]|uniref:Uncharacterized protein n=1 Tax=Phomopsis amygdali TaxID=1214568 RepID=A0AAD9SNF1_PHOAM|nr:hypothetical protein N8I77_001104 [Diaporthe amygdali]
MSAQQASQQNVDSGKVNFPTDASLPGEYFEIRQTHPTGDYKPDPSKSLPLSTARQSLIDDIIALYEMKPTVDRVKRYTPDCVYNDQFVYANDRYKMAGQWFALPKLFAGAKSHGYEVVTNDRDLIQFKHEEVRLSIKARPPKLCRPFFFLFFFFLLMITFQEWTFKVIPKTAVVNAIVSLSLDPATIDSDFIQVKYHKDQANEKDYSNEGFGAVIKKFQADKVVNLMDSAEVKQFEADKDAGKEKRREYGTGKKEGDAPVKDL